AGGGSVSANQPYFVGDNKDGSLNSTSELFIPGRSGTIVSASVLQKALGAGMNTPNLSMTGGNSGANIPLRSLDSMIGGGGNKTEYNIQQITISSEVDGERWLRRLTNDQEIVSNGLVPQQKYMGA